MRAAPPNRRLFAGLLGDAALFPPGNAPMPEAVRAHLRRRDAWYADLGGPFLCPDTRLEELDAELRRLPDAADPMPVGLIVTGGSGAIGQAVDCVRHKQRLRLVSVDVAPGSRPTPVTAAEAAVQALADQLPAQCVAFVEVARGPAVDQVLDVLAATDQRAKFRTGGTDAEAFPPEAELAALLSGCVERGLAFKCTAGLHHAVRQTARDTGFEHHGFLNVLLAVDLAVRGARAAEVAEALAERDARRVVDPLAALDQPAAVEIRRWFDSFGTCSVEEPVADLLLLGLVEQPA